MDGEKIDFLGEGECVYLNLQDGQWLYEVNKGQFYYDEEAGRMELIEGVYYRRKGDDGLWEKFLVKEGSKKADGTVKDLKDWFNPVEDLSCLSWLK